MMERQTMKHKIKAYKTDLERAIRHPILDRDIGIVNLDEAKVFCLLLPKLNGEKWTETTNKAALAVGAVHAGFDAHDTIDIQDSSSTLQQLTVLSGDYFSGIHYRLLASIPDFDFIRALSDTIGQVNEMKTNYQGHAPTDWEQLLEAVETIEVGCIKQFLHSFAFSKYIPVVSALLSLRALTSNEGTKTQSFGSARLGWCIQEADVGAVNNVLQTEMRRALDESDFIAPSLLKEIQDMTIQLLGKPI